MASRREGTGCTATSYSTAGVAVGKGKGKGGSGDSAVKQVQIDGLVVLKIIKHYQEEGQGTEVVQGVLLGLVVDDRIEITNCFPFPQHTEDNADFDEVQYQMEMMRSLRHVNIDHLHMGWYQSTYYGSFVSRALLDSQFSYQHAIEESELEKKSAVADKHELFSLASSNHLGKNLQLLMDRVDEMSQDIVKYNMYMRNASKQQQQKHQYQQRRQQETMQRQSRGDLLPEEDLSKLFKPHQAPARMDSLLIAGQINTYCQNIKEFAAQNLGKLFMAQALQEYNN
ncbi:hypothetical protein STEG23_021472 [Scotinomys teguina]